ncbi:protein eva-1 homolog C-like [Leptonychotes weddellii]|uniref:Protein eva-1 homolog C-like n=1 Tax=Leptonychotes weddellii TaxID=9713 RepID=A0A7F8Q9K5_LEPWE|nr:protein eva-1 homolog C-like [Leptonychotes weddellii]
MGPTEQILRISICHPTYRQGGRGQKYQFLRRSPWRSTVGLQVIQPFWILAAHLYEGPTDELKNKTVCEDQELKLHCHPSKFLNIYWASYGRRTQERDICSSEAERLPPFDCLSYSALQELSRRCYGKQRCKVMVNNHHFGSPCLPGVKQYLTVAYACVPKNILTAIDPAVANLKPSLKQKDGEYGIDFDPSKPRVLRKDGVIVSNSLAAFAYIRGRSIN